MLVNRGFYNKNEQGEYDLDNNGNVINQTYYGNSDRRDVVYYNGMWYIALSTAGEFGGIAPDDPVSGSSKWSMFAASLPNLATGLAFIENLWVTQLNTAGKGGTGKRVQISENVLQMFDANGEKLLITGENLSGSNASFDVTFRQTDSIVSGNGTYNGTGAQYIGSSSGVSFSCANGATLQIPETQFLVEGGITDPYAGNAQGAVIIRFGWEVDGIQKSENLVQGTIGRVGSVTSGWFNQRVTVPSISVPVGASPDPHVVKIWAEMFIYGLADASGESYRLTTEITMGQSLHIYYSDQKTEIGSNGFQVVFGSDRMLKCFISGTTATFLLRCNDVGLELSSTGNTGGTMRIMLNGSTWYYAKRNNNGLLELSITP
jgi:hypothetical protein